MKKTLVICLLFLCAVAWAQDEIVSVLDFQANEMSESDTKIYTDLISSYLVATKGSRKNKFTFFSV